MGGGWNGPPVVAANRTGGLSVFLIGDNGALYRYDLDGSGGSWSTAQKTLDFAWRANPPAVAVNPNGGLSVFLLGLNRALFRYDETTPQIDVGYKVVAPGGTSRSFATLGGTSVEAAFNFPDAIKFVDSMLAALDQGVDRDKAFPAGWLSLRVTGRTTAFLGMQQFERTGTFEVSLIGTPDDYGIVRRIEQLTLEGDWLGALHWGQSLGLMMSGNVQRFYRNLDKWRSAQRQLGGKTFTNEFMRRCGLG
jgi:hypothetical protein